MEIVTKNRHFVLVHGACLGAWSWYKVVPKLKSWDMAASGINPRKVEDIHSNMDYSEPLMEFMETLPEDERVILVAHSQGGLCISLAMEIFPKKIAAAVFVAAFMPVLGIDMDCIYEKYMRPLEFYMDCKIEFGDYGQPISILWGPEFMQATVFQLCSREDLELALLLIRPSPGSVNPEALEENNALTEENYGSIPRIYIKLKHDKLINEPVEEYKLEHYPPKELKIIDNADHMVMLSNPQDLSSYFQEISQKYH